MSEKDLCQARVLDNMALDRTYPSYHFFVTHRGMVDATGNENWIKSGFCKTLFRKQKEVFNMDGSIRGCWCWI